MSPSTSSQKLQSKNKEEGKTSVAVKSRRNGKDIGIVIFDWDDTLCPTSAIFKSSTSNVSRPLLQAYGKYVYELLVKYTELFGLSNVYIVTNASQNWVQQSLLLLSNKCQQMRVFDTFGLIYQLFIVKYRMKVLYAQHLYFSAHIKNEQSAKQTVAWKYYTFQWLIRCYYLRSREAATNIESFSILCIGDSSDEYNASYAIKHDLYSTYNMRNVVVHRIKLKRKPSFEYIFGELRFLMSLLSLFQMNRELVMKDEINIDYESESLSPTSS